MHKQINQLRADLMAQFPERKDVIDGSLAAVLAGEHVLLIGPPGTRSQPWEVRLTLTSWLASHRGERPYAPRMMVELLLYTVGVLSGISAYASGLAEPRRAAAARAAREPGVRVPGRTGGEMTD